MMKIIPKKTKIMVFEKRARKKCSDFHFLIYSQIIDVGGSFYNLIKSLYHNSSCPIKIAQNKRDQSVMREVCGKAVS